MPDAGTYPAVGDPSAWDKPLPARPGPRESTLTSSKSAGSQKRKAMDKIWAIADVLQSQSSSSSASKSSSSHVRTHSRQHSQQHPHSLSHSQSHSLSHSLSHSKSNSLSLSLSHSRSRSTSHGHSHSRGASFSSLLKKNRKPPKAPAETFWPASLDEECEKAARVLRGFCRDGSVVVETKRAKDGEDGKMIVPSNVIASARAVVILTVMKGDMTESSESEGCGILIARRDHRQTRHRLSSGPGENGNWSPPVGILVTPPLKADWPDGVVIYDALLVLNTSAALDSLSHSTRWTVNPQINAVAGPLQPLMKVLEPHEASNEKVPPLFAYTRTHGRIFPPAILASSVVTQRSSENARFYSYLDPTPIPTSDILSGKILHPPEGIMSLLTTLDALSNPSVPSHMLAQETFPAPSDYDLLLPAPPMASSPQSLHESTFGIPSSLDPDPFGVLALERIGLEIREAGTNSRPSSDQFEYRPSLGSPVWRDSFGSGGGRTGPMAHVSVDQFSQPGARRGSGGSRAESRSGMGSQEGRSGSQDGPTMMMMKRKKRRESQAFLVRLSTDKSMQMDMSRRSYEEMGHGDPKENEDLRRKAERSDGEIKPPHVTFIESAGTQTDEPRMVGGESQARDLQTELRRTKPFELPFPKQIAPPTPPTHFPIPPLESITPKILRKPVPHTAGGGHVAVPVIGEQTPPPSRQSLRHSPRESPSTSPTSPVSPLPSLRRSCSPSRAISSATEHTVSAPATPEPLSSAESFDDDDDDDDDDEDDVEIHTVNPTPLPPSSPIHASFNRQAMQTVVLQQPKMLSVTNQARVVTISKRIPPKVPLRSPERVRRQVRGTIQPPESSKEAHEEGQNEKQGVVVESVLSEAEAEDMAFAELDSLAKLSVTQPWHDEPFGVVMPTEASVMKRRDPVSTVTSAGSAAIQETNKVATSKESKTTVEGSDVVVRAPSGVVLNEMASSHGAVTKAEESSKIPKTAYERVVTPTLRDKNTMDKIPQSIKLEEISAVRKVSMGLQDSPALDAPAAVKTTEAKPEEKAVAVKIPEPDTTEPVLFAKPLRDSPPASPTGKDRAEARAERLKKLAALSPTQKRKLLQSAQRSSEEVPTEAVTAKPERAIFANLPEGEQVETNHDIIDPPLLLTSKVFDPSISNAANMDMAKAVGDDAPRDSEDDSIPVVASASSISQDAVSPDKPIPAKFGLPFSTNPRPTTTTRPTALNESGSQSSPGLISSSTLSFQDRQHSPGTPSFSSTLPTIKRRPSAASSPSLSCSSSISTASRQTSPTLTHSVSLQSLRRPSGAPIPTAPPSILPNANAEHHRPSITAPVTLAKASFNASRRPSPSLSSTPSISSPRTDPKEDKHSTMTPFRTTTPPIDPSSSSRKHSIASSSCSQPLTPPIGTIPSPTTSPTASPSISTSSPPAPSRRLPRAKAAREPSDFQKRLALFEAAYADARGGR